MKKQTMRMPEQSQRSYQGYVDEFVQLTGLRPVFDTEYQSALEKLVTYLGTCTIRPIEDRQREFIAHVNWKFRLNSEVQQRLYGAAAGFGITFNYYEKRQIHRAFNLRDRSLLSALLDSRKLAKTQQDTLLRLFNPVSEKHTIAHLKNECRDPTKLRKEKGERNIEDDIIKAQFSAFMWASVPERDMHRFFDPHFSEENYRDSFWEQLHARAPHLFNRSHALHVVCLNDSCLIPGMTIDDARHAICALVEEMYESINNYGFLAIMIDPLTLNGKAIEWELASDITLFAEKHREGRLNKAYFKWQQVRAETSEYVRTVDIEAARFDVVNEGFSYRDCFVLANSNGRVERLLLIFQKNERDETLIVCPTCRSTDVQGNSYSSIGVRSWECNNLLCPDRSKYNRGKRYAFRGLVSQQAIDDDRNQIPLSSVRRWSRDVVFDMSRTDVTEMLVRHYSLFGDTVHAHNWADFDGSPWGRYTHHENFSFARKEASKFWDGPFFRRYVTPSQKKGTPLVNLGDEDFQVLLGDAAKVLRSLPAEIFDGAVTSPPYYNAREYAQWPNMYCYLHDMLDIARQVFRTLKPGGFFVYNVFDYFDNEKTVVFSAMGQRRMILSAYTVDLFRRAGFELRGNTVWDKGEIEGKRGFNAGNFSPYYQSPFNCWEHLLVFYKPARTSHADTAVQMESTEICGRVLRKQPVIKMVRGENVHGHTAPFPVSIPELLVSRLPKGAIVLDPFGGSLTTGVVAEQYGLRSVCIERSKEYCQLGLRLREHALTELRAKQAQLALF